MLKTILFFFVGLTTLSAFGSELFSFSNPESAVNCSEDEGVMNFLPHSQPQLTFDPPILDLDPNILDLRNEVSSSASGYELFGAGNTTDYRVGNFVGEIDVSFSRPKAETQESLMTRIILGCSRSKYEKMFDDIIAANSFDLMSDFQELSDSLYTSEVKDVETISGQQYGSPLCAGKELRQMSDLPDKCEDIFKPDIGNLAQDNFGGLVARLAGGLPPSEFNKSDLIRGTSQFCRNCLGLNPEELIESSQAFNEEVLNLWTDKIVEADFLVRPTVENFDDDLLKIVDDFLELPSGDFENKLAKDFEDPNTRMLVRSFIQDMKEVKNSQGESDPSVAYTNRKKGVRDALTCSSVDFEALKASEDCDWQNDKYEELKEVVTTSITSQKLQDHINITAKDEIDRACESLAEPGSDGHKRLQVAMSELFSNVKTNYDDLATDPLKLNRVLDFTTQNFKRTETYIASRTSDKSEDDFVDGVQYLGYNINLICELKAENNGDFDASRLGSYVQDNSYHSNDLNTDLNGALGYFLNIVKSSCDRSLMTGYKELACTKPEEKAAKMASTNIPRSILNIALNNQKTEKAAKVKICEQGGRLNASSGSGPASADNPEPPAGNKVIMGAANLGDLDSDPSLVVSQGMTSTSTRRIGGGGQGDGRSVRPRSRPISNLAQRKISDITDLSEGPSTSISSTSNSTQSATTTRSPASVGGTSSSIAGASTGSNSNKMFGEALANFSNTTTNSSNSGTSNFSNYRNLPAPVQKVAEEIDEPRNRDIRERLEETAREYEASASSDVDAKSDILNALAADGPVEIPESAGIGETETEKLRKELEGYRRDLKNSSEGESAEDRFNRRLAASEEKHAQELEEIRATLRDTVRAQASTGAQDTLGVGSGTSSFSSQTNESSGLGGGRDSGDGSRGISGESVGMNKINVTGAQVIGDDAMAKIISNGGSLSFQVDDRYEGKTGLVIRNGETLMPANVTIGRVSKDLEILTVVLGGNTIPLNTLGEESRSALVAYFRNTDSRFQAATQAKVGAVEVSQDIKEFTQEGAEPPARLVNMLTNYYEIYSKEAQLINDRSN